MLFQINFRRPVFVSPTKLERLEMEQIPAIFILFQRERFYLITLQPKTVLLSMNNSVNNLRRIVCNIITIH